MLECALRGVEICAADRPIGAFGAVFMGDCRTVFSQDVWSFVGSDGSRQVQDGQYYGDSLDHPVDQGVLEEFCRDALTDGGRYCELWLCAYALRALWVKEWAPDCTKKAARILAKNRGVPLLTVSGETRIWELLDSNHLPFVWETKNRRTK
jgi:hypothetical protein